MSRLNDVHKQDDRNIAAAVLASLCFLYEWISLTPFKSLVDMPELVSADIQSNLLNQVVALALFGGAIAFALSRDARALLLQPRGLLLLLVGWLFLVTLVGDGGTGGLRRLVMAVLLMGAASAFLLLPRDEKQLANILSICAGVVLLLCYGGVIFAPERSIHQAYDFVEPALAGDWRGMFEHKNDAAPSMVLLVFIGLYIRSKGHAFAGIAIAALAGLFLVQTHGKTALMLLPVSFVLAWLVERGNLFWRSVIIVGVVAGYTTLTIGSTASPALAQLVEALGVDSTFTGRTDIWQLALDGIRASPIIGHGYDGFWGQADLVYGFREEGTWAVTAPTAHNAYVDMMLMGGAVGLGLLLVWIMFLPLRYLSLAIERNGRTPILRLFVRIWIFALTLGGMESMFMYTRGTLWFLLMMAVFGLRLEALAGRRVSAPQASAGALVARPA